MLICRTFVSKTWSTSQMVIERDRKKEDGNKRKGKGVEGREGREWKRERDWE